MDKEFEFLNDFPGDQLNRTHPVEKATVKKDAIDQDYLAKMEDISEMAAEDYADEDLCYTEDNTTDYEEDNYLCAICDNTEEAKEAKESPPGSLDRVIQRFRIQGFADSGYKMQLQELNQCARDVGALFIPAIYRLQRTITHAQNPENLGGSGIPLSAHSVGFNQMVNDIQLLVQSISLLEVLIDDPAFANALKTTGKTNHIGA